jgi:hypothetical protein
MGTSMRPVFFILPASANTLVPLLFSVPMEAIPGAAVAEDGRNVGEGLDVVDQGRAAPEAGFGGERRPGRGWPRLAFDGGEEGGFLAADEGARAQADFDAES